MGDRDELDVIRPHVAKGEPVLWRAWVSPKLFKAFAHSSEALPPKIAPAPAAVNLESQSRIWALLLMSGLVYASLVFVKARRFARACTERSATPRPIVALPPALRALLAGALFAAFGLLSVRSEPTLASLLLISSMAVATELGPRVKSGLRGPGRWLVLRDEEAFVRSSPRAAELWLDCGSLRGFALLGVLFALYGVLALELLPVSPYYSGVVALGAAALLPIFCTGRSSQLPSQPTPAAQKLLAFIAEQVRKRDGLKVVAWARIPDGGAAIDELRLLIVPRQPKAGLSSIEVGVEQHEGSAPHLAVPYVMVRARDGSASHRALPRACSWMRGRKRDERVAILRPKLPTRALCLALLRRVVQELEMPHDEAQSASSRFRISARSGSSTLKPGSTLSPSHAR
jgi:hypothetical protein